LYLAAAAGACSSATSSSIDAATGGHGGGASGVGGMLDAASAAGAGGKDAGGSGGRDAAASADAPGDGALAGTGAGGNPSPCASFGGPTTSTVRGSGFEGWNGQPVHACLDATQNFSSQCGDTVVAGGQFSLDETVCTAYSWEVTVGTGAGAIHCSGNVMKTNLTPTNCWCGPTPTSAPPSVGCDAGATDARD
jgi:hypothetical protein